MSYFVTGTDTGVGKTLVSCALLHGFAAQGKRVAGFKPVAAGPNAVGQNQDVQLLRAVSNVAVSSGQINPYGFAPAIAPHIAAQQTGAAIDFSVIAKSYRELVEKTDVVIVEGAGGLLVPLNARQDIADLVRELGLPVILVVGMRLGCLNHALLTTEVIAARGLVLAGWVANVLDGAMPALQENIDTLRVRIPAPLLGIVPCMTRPDAVAAAQYVHLERLGK